MSRDNGHPRLDRSRLRCLVVEANQTKRRFLAEAWAYFQPGFDVVTAGTTEAALEWVDSTPLRIVSLGSSIGTDAVTTIVNAMSTKAGTQVWCLIAERAPGSEPANLPKGPYRVLDMWDALSLEQVLRVARVAADLVHSRPTTLESAAALDQGLAAVTPVIHYGNSAAKSSSATVRT